MDKNKDDRIDVTPPQHCNNCHHLETDTPGGWSAECLRDGVDMPYVFSYDYSNPADTIAMHIKSCPQWQPDKR